MIYESTLHPSRIPLPRHGPNLSGTKHHKSITAVGRIDEENMSRGGAPEARDVHARS